MKPNLRSRRWRLAIVVLLSAPLLTGCFGTDKSIELTEEAVTPISAGDQYAVSATDLAKAMLRSGFSDTQILQDGPGVQAALATAGGAQVRIGKTVVALLAVHGNTLFVTSDTHGAFTIPLGAS
jgi:hypothetical protein